MGTSVGIVQEFGQSQKGSPKVKIGAVWYFAGTTDISYMKQGQKVEFNFTPFTKGTFTGNGLDSWHALDEGNGQPQPPQAAQSQPFNGVHAPAPRPAVAPSTTPDAPVDQVFLATEHLPFVSNTIAHAIDAGHIKEPADLHKWVDAARHAITGKEWLPF